MKKGFFSCKCNVRKGLLKELATKRGWEQSVLVLYKTAIIMLEEAKKNEP